MVSPGAGDGAARRKKLAIDYLLEGESVRTNPHLRAFAESTLPDVLRDDPNFKSWASIKSKSLRKEIAEASAAASRCPRAVAKALEARRDMASMENTREDTTNDGSDASPSVTGTDPLGDGTDVVFFDLCSGKGFTSVFLAHRYPKARVVMIDANKRMNLTHLESLSPRVTFHCLDLYSAETAALLRRETRAFGKNASAVVGVHLCGDLARRALELWDTSAADALVLSPCCLVREVHAQKRPCGRFGYGLPGLARRSGWDAYGLWCRFLFHHAGFVGDAGDAGDAGDGDGNGNGEATRSPRRFGTPRRDLDWDEDLGCFSQRNAFLCVSRGAPLGDACAPCAELKTLAI
jgi:hypothetical protein